VQGLNEYQPVKPIDEIYGFLDQPHIYKEQIHSAKSAEKDDEGKYAGVSGQNNGQKDEGCENCLSPLSVSRQDVGQRYSEQSGGQEHQSAQKQGISKGFKIIRVFEEFQVIAYAPAAGSGDFETFHQQN
jgi:hypothetical protein